MFLFLTNKVMIIGLAVGIGAVILAIGAILINEFVIKRSRQRKIAKELERKYSRIHELLVEDVEGAIERLYKISTQNDEYKHYFEEFSNDYQAILEENDKNSYSTITVLNQTIADNHYSGLSSVIDSAKICVNEFARKVENIYEDLNNLLHKDEEFHQKEVDLQRKYRDIKNKYSEHVGELQLMTPTFTVLFQKIENIFEECEKLNNCARYDESSEKLPLIQNVIFELDKYFDYLPEYCIRTTKVIPQKIEEVKVKYAEFEKNDYPLHHLKINSRIDIFNNTLLQIEQNLKEFKLSNIGEALDDIDSELLQIQRALVHEEECKLFFDKNQNNIYHSTYDIEKKFMKIKRLLPDYKKVYLIEELYLDKVEELQNDIDNISIIKRDLDTYIHSQTRQPYSIIVQKIQDMENEMKRIDQIINDFQQYLGSLKNDTENAYNKICQFFIALKDAQYNVREMCVNEYSKSMRTRFTQAFAYLERIGEIISLQPINVAGANEILVTAENLINGLLNDVKKGVGEEKYAENALVYANQYVQDFVEVANGVDEASLAFFQGDFNECIHDSVEMIKKIRPDSEFAR